LINITKNSRKNFKSIGDIKNIKKIERGITLDFAEGKGKILFYSPKLVRIIITPNNDFDLDYSYAIIKNLNDWDIVSFEFLDNKEKIILNTSELSIHINKAPFKISFCNKNGSDNINIICEDVDDGFGACFDPKSLSVRSYKKIRPKDHFYGFGEKTGPLDKKGQFLIMHGRDLPYKGNNEPLYQNHPFFISISECINYGIFLDNISKTIFDMGKSNEEEYYFGAEKGDLNYYFIYGENIDEILKIYTELTGRIEMPPKWAIGYHQCRYSYKTEKEIKEITSKFRETKIPCDNIWFDIHYMDDYRCFTFNKKRFPDPKGLIKNLKENGFKSIVIVDPGIKVDENYQIFQELVNNKYYATRKDGSPALGLVWPGLTYFPDFTREEVREWWADKHKFYFDLGIVGIWNDMNEPAFSINPVISKLKRLHHEDMYLWDQGRNSKIEYCKNIYAFCETWATWLAFKKFKPNDRPFILTRSGYSGIQRYAAIWTGDNWTDWKNITLAIRMLVNLNLSAQVFVGSDIGGFMGIIKYLFRDKKQFIRWIQTGVWYPFCRVHTALGSKSQDPFSYGKIAQEISKKYIELRYELLPYWYSLFYEAFSEGKPILRPLFYFTPEDEECFNKEWENQFFVGKDILIVPINKRNIKTKRVYLPEGKWIELWTLKEYEGKKIQYIPIDLKDIPIFIRKGAIIPTQDVVEFIGQKPIETLTLKIFKGDNGTTSNCIIYEDDGLSMEYKNDNKYILLNVQCEYQEANSILKIKPVHINFKPTWKKIKYIIYNLGSIEKEGEVEFSSQEIEIRF